MISFFHFLNNTIFNQIQIPPNIKNQKISNQVEFIVENKKYNNQ
jgi:hypothetical protein